MSTVFWRSFLAHTESSRFLAGMAPECYSYESRRCTVPLTWIHLIFFNINIENSFIDTNGKAFSILKVKLAVVGFSTQS